MTDVAAIEAKVRSQGGGRREDLDTPESLFFQTADGFVFSIPRLIDGPSYSIEQFTVIMDRLEKVGLELLPIDQNHRH